MNQSKFPHTSRILPQLLQLLLIAAFCIGLCFAGPSRAEETVFVRWVDDGDTIVLADGRRIRYIGINSPEIGHADKRPEPLGPEARIFNRQMVFQKYVRLEFDQEKNDHYGRQLAYIFSLADIFVNKAMLQRGYGHSLYHYPNTRHHTILLEAQRSAMKAETGIWLGWKETQGRYIGHKDSRRFHLDSCPLARKISPENRIYFTKRWDAFWQGYSPAKDCLPGGLSQ
jgi:micrococcal nuclease